jgi:hypothetical protein
VKRNVRTSQFASLGRTCPSDICNKLFGRFVVGGNCLVRWSGRLLHIQFGRLPWCEPCSAGEVFFLESTTVPSTNSRRVTLTHTELDPEVGSRAHIARREPPQISVARFAAGVHRGSLASKLLSKHICLHTLLARSGLAGSHRWILQAKAPCTSKEVISRIVLDYLVVLCAQCRFPVLTPLQCRLAELAGRR